MAKKRTKAAKIKAAAKTHEVQQLQVAPAQPALSSQQIRVSLPSFSPAPQTAKNQQIWRFDPSLIYQDLLKTALAGSLIVGILVLIYWLSF
jgi:hypothetical protein